MQTIAGDQTLALLREGYALLPNRRRRLGEDVFRLGLLGRRVVALCGEEAAQRFYDEDQFVRHGALPEPVRHTLTGQGAVHTLDGQAHRTRKNAFLPLREPPRIAPLVERTTQEWDAATQRWARRGRVVLFDEGAEVLMRAVGPWAGVPLSDTHARAAGADMVAMVDGFGTLGPRHWRGRRARRRADRRLVRVVNAIRGGGEEAPPEDSMFARMLHHRDNDGDLLPALTVAVETLNVLRPFVATTWFLAFAAHALHRWPEHRRRLAGGDEAFARSFGHEVRRFYPFGPFMGALARRDVPWDGDVIRQGTMVLLDLFGQDHDADLWEEPYAFRPERFLDRAPGMFDLVPQGGGDPATGHRCPGEDIVVAVLTALLPRLARLDYDVPEQDCSISLARIPARPRSGMVLDVRAGA